MCSDSWKLYSCMCHKVQSFCRSQLVSWVSAARTSDYSPSFGAEAQCVMLTVVSLSVRHASSWLFAELRTTLLLVRTSLFLFYGFSCLYRMPLSFMVAEICVGILRSYGISVLVLV